VVAAFTAVALVTGMLSLAGAGTAGACEDQQINLPGTARGYVVADDGQYLDGIVTNDTSQSVVPGRVKITWTGKHGRSVDEWICSGPIAPGEWGAFHTEWPKCVPATWTPEVTGYASPADENDKPLPLTVTNGSEATTDDAGARTYTVTVTNPNAFPVSCLDVQAIERDAGSGDFVDTLDTCGAPDSLGAGASADFDVTGASPWDAPLTTDIRVSALEQPTLTMSADTTTPASGAPVTFQIDLSKADGSAATGDRTIKLFWSANGEDWNDYRCYDTDSGHVTALVVPCKAKYFKAVYWGSGDLGSAQSNAIFVAPQALPDAPSAPGVVRRHRAFRVHGRIGAGKAGTGKQVTIVAERKSGSKWIKSASVKTTADTSGGYTKSVKLSSAGTYRIRAYRTGVGYSSYRSLRVTK
jgi:hypothetical protein